MSEPESGALRVRPTYPQTEVTPIGIYAPTYACTYVRYYRCAYLRAYLRTRAYARPRSSFLRFGNSGAAD